jgi:L-alanine-DL-glutamate epimerase-like enolase superfamily enzyme
MKLEVSQHSLPLSKPFSITGHTFTHLNTVWVALEEEGFMGRGEGTGSYYLGEDPTTISRQIEEVRSEIEAGITREQVQSLLPRGGARNAVDCALWDLACKQQSLSIWQLLEIEPHELVTVATIGVATAESMAAQATAWAQYPALKIKLDNDSPLDKVGAIREARPDASLVIDVNQGWSMEELVIYAPAMAALGVEMIEQPLPRGGDDELRGYDSPVPLGADESCLGLADLEQACEKYDVINIKLDKCGGLSEALAIVDRARELGKKLMVGNMTGSSLAMAPSSVIGQWCDFVDIDGPLLLERDIEHGLEYRAGGLVGLPTPALWG